MPMFKALARRYMRSHHSSTGRGEEKARHQPPSAILQPREVQAIRRRWRLERKPGQLAHELDRIPMHRSEHVEPNDLEGDEPADQGQQSGGAEINRTDLCVAEASEQVTETTLCLPVPRRPRGNGTPGYAGARI